MSIDHNVRAALRQTAQGVSKATLTAVTVSVVSDGYKRSSGSFITDGYGVGDELYVTGFSNAKNNGVSMIKVVTADKLTVDKEGGLAPQAAGASVTLLVGLPRIRVWDNRKEEPVVGRPFVRDTLHIAESRATSLGPRKRIQHEGVWFLDLFVPPDIGMLAADGLVGALRLAFSPGSELTYTGQRVMLRRFTRSNPVPSGKWTQIPLTVKFTANTINPT